MSLLLGVWLKLALLANAQYKIVNIKQEKMKSCYALNLANIRQLNQSLPGLQFHTCDVKNFSFRGSNLSGAKIQNSKFSGGDFIDVQFNDAVIIDSELQDCILPKDFYEKVTRVNVKIENCRLQQ